MNIFPNNKFLVTLTGLAVAPDGAAIADGTITAVLTSHGQAVPGVDPITLTAVSGTPGSYSAQLPAAALAINRQYELTVTGSGTADGLSISETLFSVLRNS